jgi:protocatechuate 3,4-dioxygenase beta subunit
MHVHHREPELENHDRGLDHDLPRLLQRRGLLKLVAGASLAGTGLISLAACADQSTPGETAAPSASGAPPSGAPDGAPTEAQASSDTAEGELPEETAGPYPGDGSNGANVLTESGIVRSDITSSFGSSTTKATGIPLTVTMTILDFSADKKPLAGGAVYLWHCNQQGQYSLYSAGVTQENYLRGVQQTDTHGIVTFKTIVPACYSGRWPHIHFEVYPSLAKATNSANKIATSQIALLEETCKAAYPTAGYEQSLTNLGQVSLARDNVFGDGYDLQLPKITGDPTNGYALTFSCAI